MDLTEYEEFDEAFIAEHYANVCSILQNIQDVYSILGDLKVLVRAQAPRVAEIGDCMSNTEAQVDKAKQRILGSDGAFSWQISLWWLPVAVIILLIAAAILLCGHPYKRARSRMTSGQDTKIAKASDGFMADLSFSFGAVTRFLLL